MSLACIPLDVTVAAESVSDVLTQSVAWRLHIHRSTLAAALAAANKCRSMTVPKMTTASTATSSTASAASATGGAGGGAGAGAGAGAGVARARAASAASTPVAVVVAPHVAVAATQRPDPSGVHAGRQQQAVPYACPLCCIALRLPAASRPAASAMWTTVCCTSALDDAHQAPGTGTLRRWHDGGRSQQASAGGAKVVVASGSLFAVLSSDSVPAWRNVTVYSDCPGGTAISGGLQALPRASIHSQLLWRCVQGQRVPLMPKDHTAAHTAVHAVCTAARAATNAAARHTCNNNNNNNSSSCINEQGCCMSTACASYHVAQGGWGKVTPTTHVTVADDWDDVVSLGGAIDTLPALGLLAHPKTVQALRAVDSSVNDIVDCIDEVVLAASGKGGTTSSLVLCGPASSDHAHLVSGHLQHAHSGVSVIYVTSWWLAQRWPGELHVGLRHCFDRARHAAPAVLVFRDLQSLFPVDAAAASDAAADDASNGTLDDTTGPDLLTVQAAVLGFDSCRRTSAACVPGVGIVGLVAGGGSDSIAAAIRHAFDEELELELPPPKAREVLFRAALHHAKLGVDLADLAKVHRFAHGYGASDIEAVVQRVAVDKAATTVAAADDDDCSQRLAAAVASHKPQALTSTGAGIGGRAAWTLTTPSVPWSAVGGLASTKTLLREAVVLPITHPEGFKRLGITPPGGVLLYGVPGTGKTLLAKALATECAANFVACSIAQLVRGHVGESEKALAAVFRAAVRCAPCVLFFDEFQALFADRAADAATSRLTSQLLLEMAHVAALRTAGTAHVLVVAATNHPEAIDSALLRSGRFDHAVHLEPPSQQDRADILGKLLAPMPTHSDVDVAWLAASTGGFTGADLACLCRNAAASVVASAKAEEEDMVKRCHFEEALASTSSSVPAGRVAELQAWHV